MSGYREAGIEERPHELEVATLQPRTRERIATAIRGSTCLLSLRAPLIVPRGVLAALGALGLLLSIAALVPQFGSLDPPRLPASGRQVLLGAGLVALAAAALLSAHRARVRRGMPFDPGLYLLPLDLLDARSSRLVVRPLVTLREVTDNRDIHGQGQATVVRLVFDDGAEFTFPAGSTDATRLAADLSALRTSAELAVAQKQTERLASLDPLADERPGWPAHPDPIGADRRRMPSWPLPLVPLVLPPLFALLTPSLLDARDRASDRRCLAQASLHHDKDALLRITAQGGPLAEQADAVRFDQALSEGTNEALLGYLRDGLHPAKADDWLFEASLKAGTVEALEQYLIHGRGHRTEAFESLLTRGTQNNDVSALRAYARQQGPRQEEVAQVLLPRALLMVTRSEELSPALLRQQIAFSRHASLVTAARDHLRKIFDARLATLPDAPPLAPLDAKELLRIAREHDGRLQVAIVSASLAHKGDPPLPKSYTPSPYQTTQPFMTSFAHALQVALDARLGPEMIELELVTPSNPSFGMVPLQIQFEIRAGDEPAPGVTETDFPLRLSFSVNESSDSKGRVFDTSVRLSDTTSDTDYLERVCKKDGLNGSRCRYWMNARVWQPTDRSLARFSFFDAPSPARGTGHLRVRETR
jgi:hypothetical protein